MNRRHLQYRYRDIMRNRVREQSIAEGDTAQKLFATIAQREGWVCSKADPDETLRLHWNMCIRKKRQAYRVDIKARKRVQRGDAEPQDEWIWIEDKNVYGGDGWLRGAAELTAFQTDQGFTIVRRRDLMRLVYKMVDFDQAPVQSATEARYRPYTRVGRQDRITQIRLRDLDKIIWARWRMKDRWYRRLWRRLKSVFKDLEIPWEDRVW